MEAEHLNEFSSPNADYLNHIRFTQKRGRDLGALEVNTLGCQNGQNASLLQMFVK